MLSTMVSSLYRPEMVEEAVAHVESCASSTAFLSFWFLSLHFSGPPASEHCCSGRIPFRAPARGGGISAERVSAPRKLALWARQSVLLLLPHAAASFSL